MQHEHLQIHTIVLRKLAQEEIHASNGRIQLAKDHIDRLFQSAKAMFMDLGVSETQLQDLLHKTLDENNMSNEPHMCTRWW
jgi:branched-chain amino acid aminotransferase